MRFQLILWELKVSIYEILPEEELAEKIDTVAEAYQVELDEADVQDTYQIVYAEDQANQDDTKTILVPFFQYKISCKNDTKDLFWDSELFLGNSEKQGEMLLNAVSGDNNSIFGSELLN